MNELALFAGAGGGILGGHLLSWRCVCAVECEPYAAGVLLARQNDGILPPFPIWDDVRTFDGRPWRGVVDVVSGGFPCQDISAAGKGAGIDGERSGLWKEMARIIGEVGPRFVLVENSPVLTSRGLGVVLGDLAALGYDARWGVLGAHHAGAPHKRDRIWIRAWARGFVFDAVQDGCEADHGRQFVSDAIRDGATHAAGREVEQSGAGNAGDVADADEGRCKQRDAAERGVSKPDAERADVSNADEAGCERADASQPAGRECDAQLVGGGDATVSNATSKRSSGSREHQQPGDSAANREGQTTDVVHDSADGGWWSTEPDVGRVANGVAARVDRLAALGNGQVPAVVRLAWETLRSRE